MAPPHTAPSRLCRLIQCPSCGQVPRPKRWQAFLPLFHLPRLVSKQVLLTLSSKCSSHGSHLVLRSYPLLAGPFRKLSKASPVSPSFFLTCHFLHSHRLLYTGPPRFPLPKHNKSRIPYLRAAVLPDSQGLCTAPVRARPG